MTDPKDIRFLSTIQDFRRARRRAALQDILARLTGRTSNLLSYEQVRRAIKPEGSTTLGIQEIPLDAIVGTVGRYVDFNRSFLPRSDTDAERWAHLKQDIAARGVRSPIKVYQIGQAYFVLDGHHRVSIARESGATHIPARVTEIHTRVPLSPEDSPDDIILKTEYADFLAQTDLEKLRPQADLRVTAPGQYQAIIEQIETHHRILEKKGREVAYAKAVAHWYDEVYLPAIRMIRGRGILRDFPGRTETDLYLWISEHRADLEEGLGWRIRTQEAAEHLVEQSSLRPHHVLVRIGERILEAITPQELQAGPPTGHWRAEHVLTRREDRLFGDILVAITGLDSGWRALDEALEIARREEAELHGLHVVPSKIQRKSRGVLAIQTEFDRRCQRAGVSGELAVEGGVVSHIISRRARWVDLVVLSLSYPPPSRPMDRLSPGLSSLLRNCPRPILTVPARWPKLERALLAYDGSPKAEEALFVATYLAGRWEMPLVVVTVLERRRTTPTTLDRARRYLQKHDVEATFVQERGPVAEAILQNAETHMSDLIIVGGYGRRPLLEVVLGSAVDQVMRASRRPMLICR
jgi:nucleotide-binding universal stress UspA family protein